MSWPRAIISGVVAVAIAFFALVIAPDLMLSHLGSLARSQRVGIATGWFMFSLAAMLWGLRRLQDRRVI